MVTELYKEITSSDAYKKNISSSRLAYIFVLLPQIFMKNYDFKTIASIEGSEIHLGFYNTKSQKIAVIQYKKTGHEYLPEEEAYQETKMEIPELELGKIKISLDEAMRIYIKHADAHYKGNIPTRTIIVLQVLPELGAIWNITMLRRDFKTLNIKINATTGEIKSDSLVSMLGKEFSKKD